MNSPFFNFYFGGFFFKYKFYLFFPRYFYMQII